MFIGYRQIDSCITDEVPKTIAVSRAYVGWITSIALQATMPALVKVCSKTGTKNGELVFRFKGKDYKMKVDEPLTSKVDRCGSHKALIMTELNGQHQFT